MRIDAISAEALGLLLVSGATLATIRLLDGRPQFDARRYYKRDGSNAVLVLLFDTVRTLVLICFGLNGRFILGVFVQTFVLV